MKKLYVIPNVDDIGASQALATEYGAAFEYNDFYFPAVLDNKETVEKIIAFYKALDRDRSEDTLHGVFLDVTVHSADPYIREISDRRIRQSLSIARELGVCAVIFHTNTIPNFRNESYVKGWINANERYWRAIAEEFSDLEIHMENMFDEEPQTLAALAERMSDVKNFGICFDYAHSNVFGDGGREWFELFAPYIKHTHINDNDKISDLHGTIGEGSIDFALFDREMRALGREVSVLIEMKDCAAQRRSIEYLKEHGIYPFN